MYRSFYGLHYNPFDKSLAEENHFESNDFLEMTHRLNYLKDVRGIGVFTAAPGMGKSYCLRCFTHSLNPNLYKVVYLCLSTISVGEFYKQFCSALGLPEKGGKTGMFKAIQDYTYMMYKEKRSPLIVIVDEAQYLGTGILSDLKMLMNHNFDSLNCFSLILCGESYLNNTLRKPVHEALRQRITIHYNYNGLSDEEVKKYILHKLKCAGGTDSLIDNTAISAIHGYANGNPRMIDNAMTDALTLGAQLGHKVINSETILAAIDNQQFG